MVSRIVTYIRLASAVSGDNGYGSGVAGVTSHDDYGVNLYGDARPDVSW